MSVMYKIVEGEPPKLPEKYSEQLQNLYKRYVYYHQMIVKFFLEIRKHACTPVKQGQTRVSGLFYCPLTLYLLLYLFTVVDGLLPHFFMEMKVSVAQMYLVFLQATWLILNFTLSM